MVQLKRNKLHRQPFRRCGPHESEEKEMYNQTQIQSIFLFYSVDYTN